MRTVMLSAAIAAALTALILAGTSAAQWVRQYSAPPAACKVK